MSQTNQTEAYNMEIWEKLKRPPATALKAIQAGRLKGKTDINPQWRYQIMTEVFGICGLGWRYEIKRLWTEPGSDNIVMAFAEIVLFINHDGKWSEGIPGIGGSTLVAKESTGMHSNDEAFKMATTDALSVAVKMLGVAADIYAGLWEGSKYKDPVVTPAAKAIQRGNGSHSATDGSIEALSPEDQIKARSVANRIVDLFVAEDYEGAYSAWHTCGDNEFKMAVWEMLKPQSSVRSTLTRMGKEKAAK